MASPPSAGTTPAKISQPPAYLRALHESAHIIAAIVFDFRYGDVTIKPNKRAGSFGEATVNCPLPDWKRGDGRRLILMERYLTGLYAGAAAMARHKRLTISLKDAIQRDQKTGEFLIGEDRKQAARALVNFHFAKESRYIDIDICTDYEQPMWRKARRFVALHFAKIERLAAELTKRRTLKRNQINRILGIAN
jgi:hypothetical protein